MKVSIETKGTRAGELIAAVDCGEAVIITVDGKPRARLLSLSAACPILVRQGRNPTFGMWQDQVGAASDQLEFMRQRRPWN